MMGPSTMIATPGGGDAWPGPLAEKHFAGEIPCDFETALKMVQEDGPSADVSRKGSMRSRIAEWLGLKPSDGPALRQDRHVAFDGFRSPLHDEKTERDRRYGTVYSVIECANAYLVGLELPRRIPASSLKELWKLPDEMPDYDYNISLDGQVLVVRAGVRGDAMRRLSYISASFPADFLTRIELEHPVSTFKHRLANKVLEIIVFKAEGDGDGRLSGAER
jgi:hypothetical protein